MLQPPVNRWWGGHRVAARLLLLGVVAVWGVTFALVKDALTDVSPLLFNLLRMSCAFAVLLIWNKSTLRGLRRKSVVSGLFVGAFLAAGYQFQTAALARTTAAKTAFLTGFVVVFVALLTFVRPLRPAGAAKPGLLTLIGASLAFTGLVLLTTPSGTVMRDLFASVGLGDWLALACAVAFAGHLLALGHASLRLPAGVLATLQIGGAVAVMLVTLPLGGRPEMHVTTRLVAALAITSLLATAAAFTIQSYAQQHLAPVETALILTLEPVFAWLTAVVLLHERMGARTLAGAALILMGIAVIELLPGGGHATEIPA